MTDTKLKPGRKKTGGRKKGTPNKATTEVKKALSEAFDQMGGVQHLVTWGKENPTEFYKLWVKILPAQSSDADTSQPVHIHFGNMEDND